MPTTIKRSEFNRMLESKALDVGQAKSDGRLSGVNVAKADLDGNGKIQGRAETDQLFSEVDRFDRDGSYQSVRVVDDDGVPSPVAEKMAAVGDLADVSALRALANAGGAARTSSARPTSSGAATNPEAMKKAAEDLVATRGQNYGVYQPWYNLDPNHALPTGVPLGGLKGSWKCNLFAGNAMVQAGFEPPYYGNQGKGEYPNANQMYKWSDKYAARHGNRVHFEHRGEIAVGDFPAGEAREKAIGALLSKAEAGDLVIVDHEGGDVADGGHVRVVVANEMDAEGRGVLKAAQASRGAGEIQEELIGEFTGEERIWILRPNRPRSDAVGNS